MVSISYATHYTTNLQIKLNEVVVVLVMLIGELVVVAAEAVALAVEHFNKLNCTVLGDRKEIHSCTVCKLFLSHSSKTNFKLKTIVLWM